MRLQARSVSPGVYPGSLLLMHANGSAPLVASVIRRTASWPNGSSAGTRGARSGHHATTGISGNRNGTTTLLLCPASGPESRSTTTSVAPLSPPARSSASKRASAASASPVITTITRLGCSWLAALAASMDSSRIVSLSGAITSVSTRPSVTAPTFSRSSSSFLLISLVLLSGKSTIICAAPPRPRGSCAAPQHRFALHRRRRSWPPPFPARPAEHLERRCRAPGARLVRFGLAVFGPVVEHRIQYLPSQFDFLIDRKERRFAEQHVEDQPFVGLG